MSFVVSLLQSRCIFCDISSIYEHLRRELHVIRKKNLVDFREGVCWRRVSLSFSWTLHFVTAAGTARLNCRRQTRASPCVTPIALCSW